jgi:hypothetical protein
MAGAQNGIRHKTGRRHKIAFSLGNPLLIIYKKYMNIKRDEGTVKESAKIPVHTMIGAAVAIISSAWTRKMFLPDGIPVPVLAKFVTSQN